MAKVAVGDTITWLPASKGHNVEIIAAPDGFNIPKKSKIGKEVSITFEVPGIYYYWCTPHKGMGMIGLVVVGDDTSNKDKIAKAKALGKSKKKLKKLYLRQNRKERMSRRYCLQKFWKKQQRFLKKK